VTSVDIFPDLIAAAQPKIAACGVRNVELIATDAFDLSYRARFDAIAVTGSVPRLDQHFIEMLRPQGRLCIVVGREPAMEARLITQKPDGTTTTDSLFETVLAPLINAERPEPFVL
jgi:protein-L-isoaspartate(D-aspartate) O-methyltransferase